MPAAELIPEDPIPTDEANWTDEHILRVSVTWCARNGVMPEWVAGGIRYRDILTAQNVDKFNPQFICRDEHGNVIPGIVVWMSRAAHDWFWNSGDAGADAGKWLSRLTEKVIYPTIVGE